MHAVLFQTLMVNARRNTAVIKHAVAGLQDSMGFMGFTSQHKYDARDSAAARFPALLQQNFMAEALEVTKSG